MSRCMESGETTRGYDTSSARGVTTVVAVLLSLSPPTNPPLVLISRLMSPAATEVVQLWAPVVASKTPVPALE